MGYLRIKAFLGGQKFKHLEKEIISREVMLKDNQYFLKKKVHKEIAGYFGIPKNKRCVVLDIGCRYAWFALGNAKDYPNCLFLNVDGSEKHIALARQENRYQNVRFIVVDASRLPLEDNFCDYVLIYNTFEHLDNPKKVLLETKRVLKPGGKIFLTVPNKFGRGHLDSINLGQVEEYSYFELKKMFSELSLGYKFLPLEIRKKDSLFKKLLRGLINALGIWRIFKWSSFRIILEK